MNKDQCTHHFTSNNCEEIGTALTENAKREDQLTTCLVSQSDEFTAPDDATNGSRMRNRSVGTGG